MVQKLSRQHAFELLQKCYIQKCKDVYMHNCLEREITQVIRKVEQCKSLEDLIKCIYDMKLGTYLLGLYAEALIESPPPTNIGENCE
ncbi:hypothetical protein LCGC14_1633440 [marine sediment metagenome]|uniref:Uncharacterized protein n=1 Tax=marine sediment metagenome TaxID=412755 RepID=A0A0F9KHL0_9ZZZZ